MQCAFKGKRFSNRNVGVQNCIQNKQKILNGANVW